MKIPVFVSSPTRLTTEQEEVRSLLLSLLNSNGLEPRALGRSDYPIHAPLREVLSIARHCAGALILGFTQHESDGFTRVADGDRGISTHTEKIPTPWNHLESGIAYTLSLPILVLKEDGVRGGVFDPGTMEGYVLPMPNPIDSVAVSNLEESIRKWQGLVQQFYYRPQ